MGSSVYGSALPSPLILVVPLLLSFIGRLSLALVNLCPSAMTHLMSWAESLSLRGSHGTFYYSLVLHYVHLTYGSSPTTRTVGHSFLDLQDLFSVLHYS